MLSVVGRALPGRDCEQQRGRCDALKSHGRLVLRAGVRQLRVSLLQEHLHRHDHQKDSEDLAQHRLIDQLCP